MLPGNGRAAGPGSARIFLAASYSGYSGYIIFGLSHHFGIPLSAHSSHFTIHRGHHRSATGTAFAGLAAAVLSPACVRHARHGLASQAAITFIRIAAHIRFDFVLFPHRAAGPQYAALFIHHLPSYSRSLPAFIVRTICALIIKFPISHTFRPFRQFPRAGGH